MSNTGPKTRSTTSGDPSMDAVLEKLGNIETEQKALRDFFGKKFDDLKKELLDTMINKINEVKESFDKELQEVKDKYEELKTDVQHLQEITDREPIEDMDRTVIVTNLKDNGMTLERRVDDMITTLGFTMPHDVSVSQVKRLPGRGGNTGIVKVAFDSLDSKIKVLRTKKELKKSPEYTKCWMRSSKSHIERISEMNFKTLLDLVQGGDKYKITGNGKIVSQDEGDTGGATGGTTGGAPAGRGNFAGRGWGQGRGGPGRGPGRGGPGRGSERGDVSIRDLNPRDPNRPDTY